MTASGFPYETSYGARQPSDYWAAKIENFSFLRKIIYKFVQNKLKPMSATFIYDRPVSGKAFIGRKEEKEKVLKALSQKMNVAIYEPVRSGKTSLLLQVKNESKTLIDTPLWAEFSLLNCRSAEDFLSKAFRSTYALMSTEDKSALENEYLHFGGALSDDDIRKVLAFPYLLAHKKKKRLIITVYEFQNILQAKDGDRVLRIFEEVVRKSSPEQKAFCTWIWTGSQVNAMKYIFEKQKYFFRMVQRVKLESIPYREIENHIIKGFLVSGKVIEKEQVQEIFDVLRGNIYYLNHLCAICDGLSRGYIMESVVQESILSLLNVHEPHFKALMNDLTDFQISLLKAVLDGQTRFSSAAVIEQYGLSSSANVRRIKDALCKKEVITFLDNDSAIILDPLLEYWLRKYYFVF